MANRKSSDGDFSWKIHAYIQRQSFSRLLSFQVMVEPCVFYRMLNSSFTVLVRRGVSPVYVPSPFMSFVWKFVIEMPLRIIRPFDYRRCRDRPCSAGVPWKYHKNFSGALLFLFFFPRAISLSLVRRVFCSKAPINRPSPARAQLAFGEFQTEFNAPFFQSRRRVWHKRITCLWNFEFISKVYWYKKRRLWNFFLLITNNTMQIQHDINKNLILVFVITRQ